MSKLITVAIAAINENPSRLRSVDRENEDYLGIVESIRNRGFLGAITVRQQKDEDGNIVEGEYELIDGLHRYTAAQDAGLEEIPVNVVEMDDDSAVLEAQILANVHKVETKPIEYTNQIKRLMARNPLWTLNELANRLGKSEQWLKQRLSLSRIKNERIQDLVDEGKIKLTNAYAMTRLPDDEMEDFIEDAMVMDGQEFVDKVTQRVKDIREARRKGEDAGETEWQPTAIPRKRGELVSEHESHEAREALTAQAGLQGTDAKAAFDLAIAWALHLDPVSVEAQRAKYEEQQAAKAEAKKKREAEKAAKKAEEQEKKAREAAEAAAEARAELGG